MASYSQLAPNGPRLEGSLANPTGFDWSPVNASIPNGVGLITNNSRLRDLLNFHASRVGGDFTPPSITVYNPPDGDSYVQGAAVEPSYACDDGSGSGVASCVGSAPNGSLIDTATLGAHTFTITATDLAGNTTVVTRHYTVIVKPGPMTFTLDAGATFTPTVPASSALGTQRAWSLTGSYTVQLEQSSPYFGSHLYTVTGFHLRSSSGAVFDLPPSSAGQLVCFDIYGTCQPQIPFNVTGLPTTDHGSVTTTGTDRSTAVAGSRRIDRLRLDRAEHLRR